MTHPPLLLIHGAWHDARQWADVLPPLTELGWTARAIDLPGHGRNAEPPLPGGISPHARLTLREVADAIIAESTDRPVLVAHSMTGPAATMAVELAPELFRGVVYLSAFVPTRRPTAAAFLTAPEAEGAAGGELFVADPGVVGAFRIDPSADDERYLAALRDAFYSDLDIARVRVLRERLSADLPACFVTGEPGATPDRWGSVPRGYLRCLADRTLLPRVQDLMIREADEFAPDSVFRVIDLPTDHSPFASRPRLLAEALAGLADQLVSAAQVVSATPAAGPSATPQPEGRP